MISCFLARVYVFRIVWSVRRSWDSSVEPGRKLVFVLVVVTSREEGLKTESRRDQYHSHSQERDSCAESLRVGRVGYSRWTMRCRVSRREGGRVRKGVVVDGFVEGEEGWERVCDCEREVVVYQMGLERRSWSWVSAKPVTNRAIAPPYNNLNP